MTKKSIDIKIATVPSDTNLRNTKIIVVIGYLEQEKQFRRSNKAQNSHAILVEEHCCPSVYETGFPGKPQYDQQNEDDEHRHLSKLHPPQTPVLLPHHSVRLFVLLSLPAAAKRLLQAEAERAEISNTAG